MAALKPRNVLPDDPTQTPAAARLGAALRARRKALGVSMTAAAEAAGISRVTWHRIEKGEPSVSLGAWLAAASVLALDVVLVDPIEKAKAASVDHRGWIPARIRIADYPQLQRLAWQVHGVDALAPVEALGIYERNWRHLDVPALDASERDLIDALKAAFGEGADRV